MVLVSIGAKPASDLAQKAGLRIVENGSIWVDEYMRTDAEDVFAVGDCAVKRDFFARKAAPVINAAHQALAKVRVTIGDMKKNRPKRKCEGRLDDRW
jgi:pyruvate/2-oxoglutarate dehydrogenase complex dihydrolipoamide dehydrogenase (E3) component